MRSHQLACLICVTLRGLVCAHSSHANVRILLVEDDPADVALARRGFSRAGLGCGLHVVEDGADALAFLRREGQHGSAPRPDLILIDLNMPRMDGFEFLRAVKGDPQLCSIPVLVLTTSDSQQDVLSAYQHHANAYVTKPGDFQEFVDLIGGIAAFWMGLARLPERAAATCSKV